MTTQPGKYDIVIYQGATYSRVLTWKDENSTPINLTGYTARMMMRQEYDSVDPFITLTTENGGITLGESAGTITLTISAAATSAIAVDCGVYDLELVSGSGIVSRLLEGRISVSPEVTR